MRLSWIFQAEILTIPILCQTARMEGVPCSNGKLIEGARRVGKTTIVREFAQNEYESCIFIDFARAPQSVLRLFDDMGNVSNFDIFMLKANVYSRCIEDNLR